MDKTKRVTYKKQLIRNPTKDNVKAVVIRNTKPIIPPINVSDVEFTEGTASARTSNIPQIFKKTTFNIPEISESMKSLTLSSRSKQSSKTDMSSAAAGKCPSNVSSKFDVPGAHSSLSLSKKIDRLGKVRTLSSKSISDKRSFDDKITRQVNFPYEKKIFRDLMPLSSPNKDSHTIISSREPMPPKDREPMLEDFIETKEVPEYPYIPNVRLESRRSRAHCNNLHLYKVLQFLEQC